MQCNAFFCFFHFRSFLSDFPHCDPQGGLVSHLPHIYLSDPLSPFDVISRVQNRALLLFITALGSSSLSFSLSHSQQE